MKKAGRKNGDGKQDRQPRAMPSASSSFILHPSSLRKARVLVVGDVMLDRYWHGDVSRISPEAPVPVVRFTRSEERLGGGLGTPLIPLSLRFRFCGFFGASLGIGAQI